MSASTDVLASPAAGHVMPMDTAIWPEPLNTPGVVPRHLMRSAIHHFPILEVLQRLLRRLRPDNATNGLEKVLAALGLYQAFKPAVRNLKELCIWAFTVEINIPEGDPVAKEILSWGDKSLSHLDMRNSTAESLAFSIQMGAKVMRDSHTRSAMLVSRSAENYVNVMPGHGRYNMRMPKNDRMDDKVVCLPPIGSRVFWVGLRPFLFSRPGTQRSIVLNGSSMPTFNDKSQMPGIRISTFGRSLTPLHNFVSLCRDFKLKDMTGTTTVNFCGSPAQYGGGWQSVSKAIRKLDTIDMDEDVKADIIRDADHYYSEQSRQYFADCGIPYRRGYLFHGPPGSGKSSFTAALAGHLQCEIYHINLASNTVNDSSLQQLFLDLPRKCIVVLEDIDSAGIGREHGTKDPLAPQPSFPRLPKSSDHNGPPWTSEQYMNMRAMTRAAAKTSVTLSGLLNAIDGNSSQEGRLLIMTSNNPDVLDDALTRPGRIDRRVYFGNVSKAASRSMFMRLIGRSALAQDAAFTMANVEQYATQFVDRVPANIFTPAQVQNFLQGCRGDPVRALQEIDAWVSQHQVKADASDKSNGSEGSSASIVEVEGLKEMVNGSKAGKEG